MYTGNTSRVQALVDGHTWRQSQCRLQAYLCTCIAYDRQLYWRSHLRMQVVMQEDCMLQRLWTLSFAGYDSRDKKTLALKRW